MKSMRCQIEDNGNITFELIKVQRLRIDVVQIFYDWKRFRRPKIYETAGGYRKIDKAAYTKKENQLSKPK